MPDQTAMLFRSVRLQAQNAVAGLVGGDITVTVAVEKTGLSVQKPDGWTLRIDFGQVRTIRPAPYRLEIRLLDDQLLLFSQLGYDYEAFLYQVYACWNDFVSEAMFIDEPCLIEVKGDYEYNAPTEPLLALDACQEEDRHGDSRFRLYNASLMVLPLRGPVRRIPLCFVENIKRTNWSIDIQTGQGEHLRLNRLGYDTEAMFNALNSAIQRQTERAFALLQQAVSLPEAGDEAGLPLLAPQKLMDAAWHLREGRAVDWQVLDQVCPGLTSRLDHLLRQWSGGGYYQSLVKLASDSGAGSISIGIRREQGTDNLAEDESDTTIGPAEENDRETDEAAADQPGILAFWIVVPVRGRQPAAVVEVVASKPLPQATYVFALEADPASWPQFCQLLNRGLEAVDFRRQPIYFPLAKLNQPACRKDLSALRFCLPLLFLRNAYRHRLIHQGLTGWQTTLTQLIQPQG